MNKERLVYFLFCIATTALLPTVAMSGGLLISVVDDSKHGISSDIYSEGGAIEIVIGRTKEDGKLLVPSYRCSYDKPLLAKPLNSLYFNSDQQACKTPLQFLVHSRITPSGTIAFNRVSKNVKFADGSVGQIDYKVAMDIDKHTVQLPGGANGWPACMLQYNINGYASLLKFDIGGWKIDQPQEPEKNIFTFDKKNVYQLLQHKALHAENNDKGIEVVVPGDCSSVNAKTTDEFANTIKQAVDQKVRAGEYMDLEGLTNLRER
jgi:hypothetical protein